MGEIIPLGYIEVAFYGDYEAKQATIAKLWDLCLKDDDSFHFFYELEFLLLRIKSEKLSEHEPHFKQVGTPYAIINTEWVEGSLRVAGNAEFFRQYFHLISAWALETGAYLDDDLDEVGRVFNRVVHCFYNVLRPAKGEDYYLTRMALGHAHLRGYRQGWRDATPDTVLPPFDTHPVIK